MTAPGSAPDPSTSPRAWSSCLLHPYFFFLRGGNCCSPETGGFICFISSSEIKPDLRRKCHGGGELFDPGSRAPTSSSRILAQCLFHDHVAFISHYMLSPPLLHSRHNLGVSAGHFHDYCLSSPLTDCISRDSHLYST